MSLTPEVEDLTHTVTQWRRHLHQHPEILYDVHQTAEFVATRLREFGCDEVVTGIGRTGVVGLIHGRAGSNGPTVGLRADMDALPITESSGAAWTSKIPGRMHACGHDGHTAMLLGAASQLARQRDFNGSVAVIFQPAEEGGGGGDAMVRDGLMQRFGIERVFGMHNLPGLPVGHFAIRPGAITASTDEFRIVVTGRGGHAAMPHLIRDPIVAAAAIVTSLQTLAARQADPLDSLVVSVTQINGGFAHNVIPETVELSGTVRSLTPAMRDLGEQGLRDIASGIAAAHGTTAEIHYQRNYPVSINHAAETEIAGDSAAAIAGEEHLDRAVRPMMGGEDFSYMLEARPGAFIFIGNGDTAGLHHPAYDFNDDVIPWGISYWVKLAAQALAAR
ncbi:M20 aminoacylase family protein [Pseudohoeflea coraliihabitans]|uniref:Amidohydrolase n=1 Tax=Pseudohoeflea coraliihabitans TaxID=2860393 RepID=A0ABS6WKS5_9HYPH|nr:M20 aminoacylase family protein [Pseudohoeflea sp. DP4N28-3]MBW3096549.1 amidohydrolase [Pseudohoeflea sp. DP4N28-3]